MTTKTDSKYCAWNNKLYRGTTKHNIIYDSIARLFVPKFRTTDIKADTRVTLKYLVFSESGNDKLQHGFNILGKIVLFTRPASIFDETKLWDLNATQYVSETLFDFNDSKAICELIGQIVDMIVTWNSMTDSEAAKVNIVKLANQHLVGNVIYLDHLADHVYNNHKMPMTIFGSYKSRSLRAFVSNFEYKLFGTSYVLCIFSKKEDILSMFKFLEDNPMIPEFNSIYSQLMLLNRIYGLKYEPSLMYSPEYRPGDDAFPDYSVYMFPVTSTEIFTGSFNDVS